MNFVRATPPHTPAHVFSTRDSILSIRARALPVMIYVRSDWSCSCPVTRPSQYSVLQVSGWCPATHPHRRVTPARLLLCRSFVVSYVLAARAVVIYCCCWRVVCLYLPPGARRRMPEPGLRCVILTGRGFGFERSLTSVCGASRSLARLTLLSEER